MTSLPLKYRPEYLEHIAGNESAVKQVESVLKRTVDTIPRSWLFTGESGCGKTTIARILRLELGCSDADFHEYNTSNTRGIDTIRELSGRARMAPMDGKIKVFLLDECHQLTKDAQNALLKVLEDTPPSTFFMLATTNPEKLIKAVKTRCTTIAMKALRTRELIDLVLDISAEEEKEVSGSVASAIAKASFGCPREALKILDQVIDIEDDKLALEAVEKAVGSESDIAELCKTLYSNGTWKAVSAVLKNLDAPPESVRRVVISWFNKILLDKGDVRAAIILEQFLQPFFDFAQPQLTLACYSAVSIMNGSADTKEEDVPF